MEMFLAPNGERIAAPDGRIMTFGLDEEDNKLVKSALPTKNYELFVTDVPTDLIAISAAAVIINVSALDTDSRGMIFDYYTELGANMDETVFWIGCPKPPHPLRVRFKCYEYFPQLAKNLKYHLLTAHRKVKKSKEFSKKMADCLMILSFIRLKPGIRTQELADKLEVSVRTVQRYISTLQAAGEWIEYDTAKKGWRLQFGISVLFGDHLEPV